MFCSGSSYDSPPVPAFRLNKDMLARGLVDCHEFDVLSAGVSLILPDDSEASPHAGRLDEQFIHSALKLIAVPQPFHFRDGASSQGRNGAFPTKVDYRTDAPPPASDQPGSKPGDLSLCGKHRICTHQKEIATDIG